MGLGGIARDSIIGLNNLVHDDDDDDNRLPPRRTGSSGSLILKGSDANEFLFLDGENSNAALPIIESTGSFETSLNDGMSSNNNSPLVGRTTAASPATAPRSSAATAAATAYSKVSATNSRPLESYRADTNVSSYSGFQYEGYTDYYSETDYASYNHDEYSGSGRGESSNIFCCLFAPWMQNNAVEAEDNLSVTPSSELKVKQEQARQKKDAIAKHAQNPILQHAEPSAAAATPEKVAAPLSPTPSLKEKIPVVKSLMTGTMPPPTPQEMDPPVIASVATTTPKKAEEEPLAKAVNFASPQNAVEKNQPTTPHMLAGNHLESTSSSSFGSAGGCDEKKQEDGDVDTLASVEPSSAEEQEQEEKEDEEDEDEEDSPPPFKSILKVRRCSAVSVSSSSSSLNKKGDKKKEDKNTLTSTNKQHRHLFPTYEPKASSSNTASTLNKSINFNPMARVLTIPSRKDISFHQKAQVWWQKCDYDEFKKTGRIISKAMECGGSEIWLASSNAWGSRQAAQSTPKSSSDEEYNKALERYVGDNKRGGNGNGSNGENTTGNKWWCKFGHSRRGLEHVASSSEGRARQQSVLLATRMVLQEQKRQRASRTKDPNKLRNIAMQYTSWARDLSLAGGAADAEAVASNFDPAAASRAHHFAKQLNVHCTNSLQRFQQNQSDAVGGGVAMAITSQLLDANTHAKSRTSSPPMSQAAAKSLKDIENSLKSRATGYMPGGRGNMGFRSVAIA